MLFVITNIAYRDVFPITQNLKISELFLLKVLRGTADITYRYLTYILARISRQ